MAKEILGDRLLAGMIMTGKNDVAKRRSLKNLRKMR